MNHADPLPDRLAPTGPIGHWPGVPPVGPGQTVALWLDGSTAGAALACLLSGAGVGWLALLPEGAGLPARALAAAGEQAEALGVPARPFAAGAPFAEPLGWGGAHAQARAHGATWLVAPLQRDAAAPPLPLRMAEAERALRTWGLAGLWAPLLGYTPVEVARLALALGVDFARSWDCQEEERCGRCAGCAGRLAGFKQLGLRDPLG